MIGRITLLLMICWAALPAAPMALVGSDGEDEYVAVEVNAGELVGIDAAGGRHLPSGLASWDLTGDWREAAERFRLSPFYSIDTFPAPPRVNPSPTVTVANISLHRGDGWEEREFDGAVVVFVWIVDGEIAAVRPKTVPGKFTASGSRISAVFELPEDWIGGNAAVLLWQSNGFAVPRPRFRQAAANAALFHIVTKDTAGLEADLAELRNVDVRSREGGHALLQFAAEAGNVEALELLLARGAKINRKDQNDSTPLHWAAMNRRDAAIDRLLAAGARHLGNRSEDFPFDNAWQHGAMATALKLYHTGSYRLSDARPLSHAFWLGDEEAVAVFRANLSGITLYDLSEPAREAAIESANIEVLQSLLMKGLSSENRAKKSLLLNFAARAGRIDATQLLLQKGELALGEDPDGVSAVDEAAARGYWDLVALLREHGALEHRRLPEPAERRVADQMRNNGSVYRVWEVDRVPVVVAMPEIPLSHLHFFQTTSVYRPKFITVGLFGPSDADEQQRVLRSFVTADPRTDHYAIVTGIVEIDGTVSFPKMLETTTLEIRENLEELIREYRFQPGMVAGEPVRTRLVWQIRFESAE